MVTGYVLTYRNKNEERVLTTYFSRSRPSPERIRVLSRNLKKKLSLKEVRVA